MKAALNNRLRLAVGSCCLALVVLCALIALTYANFRRLGQANRWKVHTYQVLDKVSVLRASLGEEELRVRGFALTGAPQFLRAAKEDQGAVREVANELHALTADRQEQQARLDKFISDYERWRLDPSDLQGESPTIATRRLRAQTLLRRSKFLALKDQLLAVENFERVQLAARARQQESSQNLTAKLLLAASVFTIFLSSLLTLWLASQMRSLSRFNAQLHASEEQLRTVLDNAPIVLYRVDLAEKFVLLTGKSLDKMGLDGKNAAGRSFLEVIGPNYNMEPLRAALRGEPSVTLSHFRGLTFETHRHPLRNHTGAITGMIGVAIDVTERQKAENALRESEARFQTFMDNSPMLAFIKDQKGRMIYVNNPMLRRFDKTESEMIGKDDYELWPPETARSLVEHDKMVLEDEKSITIEESVLTPDGDSPTWLTFKFPLRDAAGQKLVGGLAIDISERKVAEEKLRATSVLQRAILDGAPYSIIAASPDGTIQSFNRAAERMLGYRAGEICGVQSADFFHEREELSARAAQLSQQLNRPIAAGLETLFAQPRAGMIEEREWTYVRRDGSRFPVRLSVSALHGSNGQISGYVAIGYDLTESQRAERIKNEFVSVVSHELRTPLTSIRGALGLLAGGVAGELPIRAQQMIEIAQKNSDRLVLLINDILDIEKIESGKMRFDLHPLALREWLESAVEQNSAYAQALGVTLRLENAVSLDSLQVLGDESRLQQVLSNLLSNACKFTPSGGVVRLRAKVETNRDWRVVISVEDEGPGVPSEFVPRLFEKFAQADSSSTRKQGGTGLGLPIARAIVEKHGGSLDYRAPQKMKEGATFHFDLPLVQPEVRQFSGETDEKTRVLICEDDAETAALLAAIVTQCGYRPAIAATLSEARALLGLDSALDSTKNQADIATKTFDSTKNQEFAGMTLDLMLPDGNGADLIGELRAAGRDLPIIVVSAFIEAGNLHGEALQVLDWMSKPLDGARLQSALRQFRGPDVPRLLHVEDDGDVCRIVAAILGESASIAPASTLRQARQLLQNERFDLAILDISLPDGSALDLMEELNASEPPTPIIMFSARETKGEELQGVVASLVKSRTDNDVLRSTIRRFLRDDISTL